MGLYLERVWLIYCTRCSNQAERDGDYDSATAELAALGWTQEDGDQYCPGCNGVGR